MSISARFANPLSRVIMIIALVLAVGLPLNALAAPAQQSSVVEEAVLIGYYESEPIDDGDFAIVVSLGFYDDATFDLTLGVVDADESLNVNGEYVATDDGLLLTPLTVDGIAVEEDIEIVLVWDADDSLVILGGPDGALGEEDIILYPVAIEDEATVIEVGGVYVSGVSSNDDGDSAVFLLNLLPDGSAGMVTDSLDLTAPEFEVGAWEDNGDGTVTLTVLGVIGQDYDEAIVIDLVVGANGELAFMDQVVFYPLAWLSTAGAGSDEDIDDEAVTGDALVYTADFVIPDSEEVVSLYMMLYDDGSVTMTDVDETESVYGEWILDDTTLVVTLLEDDNGELDEPVELTFEEDEDGVLIATDYPLDIFGEDGLTFYPFEEDAATDE